MGSRSGSKGYLFQVFLMIAGAAFLNIFFIPSVAPKSDPTGGYFLIVCVPVLACIAITIVSAFLYGTSRYISMFILCALTYAAVSFVYFVVAVALAWSCSTCR